MPDGKYVSPGDPTKVPTDEAVYHFAVYPERTGVGRFTDAPS